MKTVSMPPLALAAVAALAAGWTAAAVGAEDLSRREQAAFDGAVAAVEASVVQISTIGGLEQAGGQTLALGPTTGLIVSPDGYIVSSAFNFVQHPSSILVRLPSGRQLPAVLVGRDTSRMLVLLKVETNEVLPVPRPVPIAETQVGAWAIAVGRTYDANQTNVSVGIVSALNRMHGRALQSDVSASAANYGGPLVDLRGRVLGIIVPLAPQPAGASDANELAGVEFYDSGIAFAIPLEHVLAVLDRWTAAGDLRRGLLGVGMKDGNPHTTAPEVTAVWPRSPAARAGWKTGDLIVAIDGEAVATQTQLRFYVAPRYAGDALQATIRRGEGDDAVELRTTITLAAELEPFRHAFLGVLPERLSDSRDVDETAPGVVIRGIWPGSPADKAGLEPGDAIEQLGDLKVESISSAIEALNAKNVGDELVATIRRGDKRLEFAFVLDELPTEILPAAQLPPHIQTSPNGDESLRGDGDLQELKLPEFPQTARYLAPPDGKLPRGLLVWLSDGNEASSNALAEAWREACIRDQLVLLMPTPSAKSGWTSDDMEYLQRILASVVEQLAIDRSRVVVAGAGKGGQLAYSLSFSARKLVRGVATVDSPMPRTLTLPENTPNHRLAVLAIETRDAPLGVLIRRDAEQFSQAAYPVTRVVRDANVASADALDAESRAAISRWIDGLDRF